MTTIELLDKHARFVKKNKLTSITKYNEAEKPSGYYATGQTIYKRFGKDVVASAFGWETTNVPAVSIPLTNSYNEFPVKPFIVDWYKKLPKKKNFTITDCMKIWPDKYQSNVSNILIYMANNGLLGRSHSEIIDIKRGRPKVVYTRCATINFRRIDKNWTIATRRIYKNEYNSR